jgi:phosphate transport system ATP-binding protein
MPNRQITIARSSAIPSRGFVVAAQNPNSRPSELTEPQPKLLARHVTFRYGERIALKNVTVPLFARKVTAFIGPSGCGKSTLLRVFNRMYDFYPDQHVEGEVLLDGKNILDPAVDLNELRARIGMVF